MSTMNCFNACVAPVPGDIPGTVAPPACDPCPPPTNTVTGIDCTGAPVSVTGPGVIRTVPDPQTVQLVKICAPGAEYDHTWLCDPVTGNKINVITTYGPMGVPVVTAFTVTGSAWVGNIADLVVCPDSDVESDAIDMCDGTTNFIRWILKKDGQPTGVSFDTDLSGAPYAPVGVPVKGACAVGNTIRVYLERNGGTVSVSDIVAATGSNRILSITVKQVVGTGSLNGDSGSGVPMWAGETWSWSSVSENNADSFALSNLMFDAAGGEQRITATYI